MFSFSIILTSLHSLNLSFPLLFHIISITIPIIPIVTLILRIFCIPAWIPDQDFIKIVNLVKKKKSPVLLLHNPPNQIIFYIIWDVISDITKKLFTLSASNL